MFANAYRFYVDSFSGLSKEIWFLSLITLINRSGSLVIAFLSLYLTEELGFGLKESGIIMTFFGVGSLFGNLLGGYLTDRVGYYKVQFWSLLLSGIFFILLYHVKTFEWLCVFTALTITVAESFRPANMASFAVYSKPENLTRSIGLYRMAVNLGFALGPAFGGFMAAYLSYQWLFYVDGVTCSLAAIAFMLLLKKKSKSVEAKPETVEDPSKIRSVLNDYPFMLFLGLVVKMAVVFMQLIFTIPLFYRDALHLNEVSIGYLLTFNGILIAVLEMPIIFIIEKRKLNILKMMLIGAFLIGLSFAIFFIGHWLILAVLAVILISVGEILNFPMAGTFTILRSHPSKRGEYSGWFGIAFAVGIVIAPSLGTYIIDHYGFNSLWTLMCVLVGIIMIGYTFLMKMDAAESEKQ